MATKVANANGPPPQGPHTSGLYADMTLDGPEIGTLVFVVDRAKNLPNRKTMGKQNPYCAARLGKEAKKTETDRRGGQTPRWDQELRFIVHDSPDYNKMKISIFSEDKRTDLVGEAWIELTDVIVPGGGKKDYWQELNFKGKYAGELRIELTYYDERPKPVEPEPLMMEAGKVRRRPLPSTVARNLTPDTIPDVTAPGRAKHGPRDLRTPLRANSMPPDFDYPQSQPGFPPPSAPGMYAGSQVGHSYPPPQIPHQQYEEPDFYDDQQYDQRQLPDFLPQLPLSNRHRTGFPPRPPVDTRQPYAPAHPLHTSPLALQHSQSSPAVPTVHQEMQLCDDSQQLRTEYSDPIPDVDYQYQQLGGRQHVSDGWQDESFETFNSRQPYAPIDSSRPPPPPMHSNSSPAVPQRGMAPVLTPLQPYEMTPPHTRHQSIPNSSPLQNFERKFAPSPGSPMQGSPVARTPMMGMTPSPQRRGYDSPPSSYTPGQTPSPFARQEPPLAIQARHSIGDPYNGVTPPRPHPLSQEVPRARSPQPPRPQDYYPSQPQAGVPSPYQQEYRSREGLPLMRPRPVSPQVLQPSPQPRSQPPSMPRAKSAYDIQFPVRSFESDDTSPLSTSRRDLPSTQTSNRSTPLRKSVSPHPTPPHSAGGVPFSPDSFNVHNPTASSLVLPNGNSPHSPYQIRPGSEAVPRDNANEPIVDWHGQEVDPSDRLPVHSWAPEPEVKTPLRTYGLGRDRDFGPRTPQSATSSGGKNLSNDTKVNVRMRSQTNPPEPAEPTSFRNRLQKKVTPTKNPVVQPLQERHNYNSISVPNPYEQQEYGSGFHGRGNEPAYSGSYAAMSEDALSREISSIDIGGGAPGGRYARAGSVPAPTAFVPVRSHKDRRTFY